MKRSTFLTGVAPIALSIGLWALLLPASLLLSKGVVPTPATSVWVREVGALLVAIGTTSFWVRRHPDSPTMQAFLAGNAIVQLGLLPIELIAFQQGVITEAAGVIPNTILHLVLAVSFAVFAWRTRRDLGPVLARQ